MVYTIISKTHEKFIVTTTVKILCIEIDPVVQGNLDRGHTFRLIFCLAPNELDMRMQPSPRVETNGPFLPKLLFVIVFIFDVVLNDPAKMEANSGG